MKKYYSFLAALSLLLLFSTCKKNPVVNDSWLIPIAEVFDGGPGKDGIPAVDNPQFGTIDETNLIAEEDLVIGFKVGNTIRAYPHFILDWHEIVNDEVEGIGLALTYCPLTGTAIGWDPDINGQRTTFGVSGLLYNSNLIPYDRNTDSNWTQMGLECVNGDLSGNKINTIPLIETSWATWKSMFPDSEILSTATGFSRNYGTYPYGNYKTSDQVFYALSVEDSRLHKKERVLGVFGGGTQKAYRFSSFDYGGNTTGRAIIMDEVGGESLVLVASEAENIIVAFKAKPGVTYTPSSLGGEGLLMDDQGNGYNIFGENILGGTADLELQSSFIGYWFSWGTFYPGIEIYGS